MDEQTNGNDTAFTNEQKVVSQSHHDEVPKSDGKSKTGDSRESDIVGPIANALFWYGTVLFLAFFVARQGVSPEYFNTVVKIGLERQHVLFVVFALMEAKCGIELFRVVRFLRSDKFFMDKAKATRIPWRTPLMNIGFAIGICGILFLTLPLLYRWGVSLGKFKFSESVYQVFCSSSSLSLFIVGFYVLTTIVSEIAYNLSIIIRCHAFFRFKWLHLLISSILLLVYWIWCFVRTDVITATMLCALIGIVFGKVFLEES